MSKRRRVAGSNGAGDGAMAMPGRQGVDGVATTDATPLVHQAILSTIVADGLLNQSAPY